MKAETFEYRDKTLGYRGFLAAPGDQLTRPGVLVLPEGPGLGQHARQRAVMLAELGYIALAADLNGGGYVTSGHEETLRVANFFTESPQILRQRVAAAFEALGSIPNVDHGRRSAVGYCLGGFAALEFARAGAPLRGVVTFHALLTTKIPEDARNISAKVLVCTGAHDSLVPREQVSAFENEMSEAGVDWQLIIYGGARHAFTNKVDAEELSKVGFGYDEHADRRSWQAMREFLQEVFQA